jgi:hypothetical protein
MAPWYGGGAAQDTPPDNTSQTVCVRISAGFGLVG